MKDAGHITQEQYDEAMSDNVYARIKKVNNKLTKSDDRVYSYFVDEVVKQVLSDLQEQKGYTYTQAYNAVYSGGLKIYTTQDSDIQKICDKELSDSANYPYAIKYSINWAWSVQNPDGSVDNYSEKDMLNYHRNSLNESSFKLIFSSKEEAKACVKAYKMHLMNKYYKKGIDKDKGYAEYENLYYNPQPQVSFTVMDQYTVVERRMLVFLLTELQTQQDSPVQHLKFYQLTHLPLILWVTHFPLLSWTSLSVILTEELLRTGTVAIVAKLQ